MDVAQDDEPHRPIGNAELAQEPPTAPAGPIPNETLALGDLLPDARNEVEILGGSGHDIAVVTHEAISAQGVAETMSR